MKILQLILMIVLPTVCGAQAGNICNFAGGGNLFTDGVLATSEYLGGGGGICNDKQGNIYYADYNYAKVYKVDITTGLVYHIAGYSTGTPSGDGGPATAAELNNPNDVAVDSLGNIYIADIISQRIRKVDVSTGIITTVAGGGNSTADGVPATTASLQPYFVYLDRAGNIFTGSSDFRVRKIDQSTGLITTIAGNGTSGISGDGGAATNASLSGLINSVAIDIAGNLYIVDMYSESVRMVSATTGVITTIAGGGASNLDDIPATNFSFCQLYGCSVDAAGNIYTSDACLGIHRIDAITGKIKLIAGQGASKANCIPALSASARPYRIFVDIADGYIYFSDFSTSTIRRFPFFQKASVPSIHDDILQKQVYPNPASILLNIKADKNLFNSYTITNNLGSILVSGHITQDLTVVNIEVLPAGLYFVNLNGVSGNSVGRFVKM